jgi:hypothetical protein
VTNRIKITSSSATPFRISAPGVDVNGATFDGLLFDGNQKPLRVFTTGYILAPMMNHTIPGFVSDTPGPTTYSTPSGTYPLFTIAWKWNFNTRPTGPVRTVGGLRGCGATMDSGNRLHALNFADDSVEVGGPASYVNYLIFKNYG